MKSTLPAIGFFVSLLVPAEAAPNGNHNLEIKTKFPWPISVSISGDKLTLKSRGRTKVHGSTKTTSASGTKIVGKANFSTKTCEKASVVTVTLKFSKDGKFKSGSAKGKCVRAKGNANFSGRVVQK